MHMADGECLSSLMSRIDTVMHKIKNLRPQSFSIDDLDKELVSMTMIRSLPDSYSNFASSLQLLDKLDEDTLQAAFVSERPFKLTPVPQDRPLHSPLPLPSPPARSSALSARSQAMLKRPVPATRTPRPTPARMRRSARSSAERPSLRPLDRPPVQLRPLRRSSSTLDRPQFIPPPILPLRPRHSLPVDCRHWRHFSHDTPQTLASHLHAFPSPYPSSQRSGYPLKGCGVGCVCSRG